MTRRQTDTSLTPPAPRTLTKYYQKSKVTQKLKFFYTVHTLNGIFSVL